MRDNTTYFNELHIITMHYITHNIYISPFMHELPSKSKFLNIFAEYN